MSRHKSGAQRLLFFETRVRLKKSPRIESFYSEAKFIGRK